MSDSTIIPPSRRASVGTLPRKVAWLLGSVIGTLMAGAVYLMLVRGDAILEDLSALSGYVFCY